MTLILAALGLLLASGLGAFLLAGTPRLAARLGGGGAVGACLLAILPAIQAVTGGTTVTWEQPWAMPLGSLTLVLDPLAGFFLIPILLLSALAAIYGIGYLEHGAPGRKAGASWLGFNLLVGSMVAVVLAGNAVLFLLAWEVMALSSFFLVAYDHEKREVRRAAWLYLIATHLGTAPLLPMFLLFGAAAGSLQFSAFAGVLAPAAATAAFLLALIGFGTKAGVIPFHIWLPEAHPAAPSHVSALMSGVMIKTGIYALVRVLTCLGPPPLWWGALLLGLGAVSGVLGVLFALAQHDLKRLLAYHSVENIGIILIGLGVGVLGLAAGSPVIAGLGFAGGLLHMLNHALFKGLLFMGAGAVIHAAGTGDLERLGGLLKRMPRTGFGFLVGSAAIVGLPPLNGFISEFLIFLGLFLGAARLAAAAAVPLALGIVALALIGGLAAACFAKAFGIVFLGEPRSAAAANAREAGPLLTVPMLLLAAACCLIGCFGPLVAAGIAPAVGAGAGPVAAAALAVAARVLSPLTAAALGALLLAGALWLVRSSLLRGRAVRSAPTWDCGYAAPTSRMQYTASSFAQPLTDLFRIFLRTKKEITPLTRYFPAGARLSTETPDVGRERVYRPLFHTIQHLLARLGPLQEGRLQAYVLYMVLTLLALLLWNVR